MPMMPGRSAERPPPQHVVPAPALPGAERRASPRGPHRGLRSIGEAGSMRVVVAALVLVFAPALAARAEPPARSAVHAPDAEAGQALALVESALAGAGWTGREQPSPPLLAALGRLAAATASDAGCARIAGRLGGRIVAVARRARSAEALDAVASCSERIGLAALAARLRAARARDFGAPPAPPAGEGDALADGPLGASSAYARGDFAAAKAMAGAGPWAALGDAAQTARRARIALDAASVTVR